MGSLIVFGIAGPILLIFLARWIYRSPQKIYRPLTFIDGFDSFFQRFFRFFSVVVIFAASMSLLLSLVQILHLFSTAAPTLLCILGGILFTWFLTPRMATAAQSELASVPPVASPNHRHKKLIRIILTAAIVIATGAVLGLLSLLGNLEVTKLAFAKAESDPAIVERLGEPIRQGWLTTGSVNMSGMSGSAEISVPISGPQGKGTLYVVATKSEGIWTFSTLHFLQEGEAMPLDLLSSREH